MLSLSSDEKACHSIPLRWVQFSLCLGPVKPGLGVALPFRTGHYCATGLSKQSS